MSLSNTGNNYNHDTGNDKETNFIADCANDDASVFFQLTSASDPILKEEVMELSFLNTFRGALAGLVELGGPSSPLSLRLFGQGDY